MVLINPYNIASVTDQDEPNQIKLILISGQHRICSSSLPVYCEMTAESWSSGTRRDVIASLWLGKHVPAAMDAYTTREELLEVVFSTRSMSV
jgi:hypothetical protein